MKRIYFIEILLRSKVDPLEFNIVVPQETTEEEMRAIAHSFLKKLTDVSNVDLTEGSLWSRYSYIVHIENGIDGYYDTGSSFMDTMNQATPLTPSGYSEIIWTEGLRD